MYVFAILFTSSIAEPGAELEEGYNAPYLFATMGDSMMTLFTNGVLGDNLADTIDALVQQSVLMMWMFFLFSFISSLTLLNMLIGVLCEVVAGEAVGEKEKLEECGLRFVIEEAFATIDANHDGKVSEAEWQQIKGKEEVREAFIGAGLDASRIEEELEDLKVGIFGKRSFDEGFVGLSLEELCIKALEIRPGKTGCLLELKRLEARQDLRMKKLAREMQDLDDSFRQALHQRNLPIPRSASKGTASPMQALPTSTLLHALRKRSTNTKDLVRAMSNTSVIDLTAPSEECRSANVFCSRSQASNAQPPRVWFSEEPDAIVIVPQAELTPIESLPEQLLPPMPELSSRSWAQPSLNVLTDSPLSTCSLFDFSSGAQVASNDQYGMELYDA